MTLDTFLDACGSGLAGGTAAPLGLFLAGLAGSVGHCVPMCGPFTLAQSGARLARVPALRLCELSRLRAGLLLPYHVGRLTTYAGLGIASAALGGALTGSPWFKIVTAGLLFLGAALFILQGARRFLPTGAKVPTAWFGPAARFAARIDRGTVVGGYLLGVILGFLPCGLLYAALAIAAATGEPVRGAAAMVGFGLGTIPALVMIGTLGHSAQRRWPQAMGMVGEAVMLFDGLLLIALGAARLA